MGDLSAELESLLFAAFLDDIDRGWLQRYPFADPRFAEASNLIARCPEQPLRTLDALHLTLAAQAGISMLATADAVMAKTARADSKSCYGLSSGWRVAIAQG